MTNIIHVQVRVEKKSESMTNRANKYLLQSKYSNCIGMRKFKRQRRVSEESVNDKNSKCNHEQIQKRVRTKSE